MITARLMGWCGSSAGFRLFLPEELSRYRGGPGDPGLYLALLGRVSSVSSGRRHYEPGAHYSGFAGIGESVRPLPPARVCGRLRSFRSFLYSSVSPPSTFVLLSWRTGLDFTIPLVSGRAGLWPAVFDLYPPCPPLSVTFA